MRSKEFLAEDNLSAATFYKLNRLNELIRRLEKGDLFQTSTGKEIVIKASRAEIQSLKALRKLYDETGTMPGGHGAMVGKIPHYIGGVRLGSLFKDPNIGGQGGSKVTTDADAKSSGNVGPALELWKSVAIYARLTHREDRPITFNDLKSLVSELDAGKELIRKEKSDTDVVVSKLFKEVPDFNKKVKDTLSLKVDLGLGPYQRAVAASPKDAKLWGNIQGVLKFVNENNALKRYNKIFSMNGRVDPIKVALVGGSGAKTDIQTSYLDTSKPPEVGADGKSHHEKKALPSLTFSVKSGSSKVNQSPGTTIAGIRIMFGSLGLSTADADAAIEKTAYQEKPKMKKGAVEDPKIITQRHHALTDIFGIAAQELDNKLRSLTDKGEGVFIKHFLSTLTQAFTGGANLIYVDFDAKGTYFKLNPHQITNLTNFVDLGSAIRKTPKGLLLEVADNNSSRVLFQMRLQSNTSGRLTILFELRDLLKLTKEATEKLNLPMQRKPSTQQTVTTAPAKSASVTPALKVSQQTVGQDSTNDAGDNTDYRFSGE